MPKLKTGKWSPEEANQLISIPKDAKLNSRLTKIATKLNRDKKSVYQKWYSLNEIRKPKLKAKKSDAVMTFDEVPYDGRQRVSSQEEIAMQKGIDVRVSTMVPASRRGILIPKKYMSRARNYVRKTYPDYVFTFHVSKNPKFLGYCIMTRVM